ncbi:flavin reductase [candidate division KSB1 bacterium]|nr:flavin reductase [candidate division KSB1 bacterium]
MSWRSVAVREFNTNIFDLWDNQWFLLTCGDFASKRFNSMTVSWGSLGIMWNKPFAQVVVRPTRYTFEFMEKFDFFTLCAFDRQYRKALQLIGSYSGRHGDKIARAGLTPVAAQCVAAPCFAEARLVLECRKIFWQDFDPAHFLDASIAANYAKKDYHRIYFGEVLNIGEKIAVE